MIKKISNYGEEKKKTTLVSKRRVFVAMSGGVDSSVAAALLKKKGHDVHGIFIKGYYPPGTPCAWREDRRDAMRVAARLDIPFYTFDFSKEYKKYVVDYMIKEYCLGRTPNPDIMCNKFIKFDAFLKKALAMGADKIATGHYVQMNEIGFHSFILKVAKDLNKDQSYFLWTLTQDQLKYCLFPIGDYLKSEVRQRAKKFKLPVFDKKDSQGLCFVGEFKMSDFLKRHIKPEPGKILNSEGETLGSHSGVQYYTIGQRHGLKTVGDRPYYVVAKNLLKNTLTVSTEPVFGPKEVEISNTSWIAGRPPQENKKYLARVRYRQPLQKCKIKGNRVLFDSPQKAAAGQSLVLYDRNKLLGGGVII